MARLHSSSEGALAIALSAERTSSLMPKHPLSVLLVHSPHAFSRWKSHSSTLLSAIIIYFAVVRILNFSTLGVVLCDQQAETIGRSF